MLKIFQIVIFSSASSTRNPLNLDKLLMLQTIFSHWSSVIALNSIMLSFYHLAGATHIHADHEVWRDLEPILGGLCASFQHKRSKKMWAHSNGQQFLNSCADWLSAKHVHALARTQKERERRIKNVGNGEIKRKYMCVPFSTLHMCRDIVTAKKTQTLKKKRRTDMRMHNWQEKNCFLNARVHTHTHTHARKHTHISWSLLHNEWLLGERSNITNGYCYEQSYSCCAWIHCLCF